MTIDTKRLRTDAAYWDECGAPKDATHFSPPHPDFDECWMKFDGKWQAKSVYSTQERWGFDDPADDPSRYIPRPQALEDEWVDGLPPKDSECEVMLESGKWEWCQVKAHSGSGSWIVTKTDDRVIRNDLVKWRPIPTKAQRDRDELKGIIADSEKYGHDYIADAIIAAGWTKP